MKKWIDKLREECLRHGSFWSMPDEIYDRYVGETERLFCLSDDDLKTFCLLVCEAEA
jgi:hypothetical protein